MADRDYRPRLSIEISPKQKQELDRLIGHVHGMQRALFSVIIDDLIRILNHPKGQDFLAAMLQRHVTLLDLVDIPMTEDDLSRVSDSR